MIVVGIFEGKRNWLCVERSRVDPEIALNAPTIGIRLYLANTKPYVHSQLVVSLGVS